MIEWNTVSLASFHGRIFLGRIVETLEIVAVIFGILQASILSNSRVISSFFSERLHLPFLKLHLSRI